MKFSKPNYTDPESSDNFRKGCLQRWRRGVVGDYDFGI